MEQLHRQLVLNKAEDWQAPYRWGIVPEGDGLTLPAKTQRGVICLKGIDSGEKGFRWERLSLDCVMPADSMIRVYAYAADTPRYLAFAHLEEYLAQLTPGSSQAAEALEDLFAPAGQDTECLLGLQGRYLWLMLELIAVAQPPQLTALSVQITGDHMVDYLPAIYQDAGGFTKRFLSIFDSLLMDMEQAIYELPAQFDFENASGKMLEYLAQWMCIEPESCPPEALAERIRTAQPDYESMYTVRGIQRSVERFTGRRPLLIESANVDPNKPGCVHSALYRRLYGENPYRFFILLPEDAFQSRSEMEAFLSYMQGMIPVGTQFELILLKRCLQLDQHTYLGINTVIGGYTPAVIDENITIRYDTMIGGEQVEGR